jgi:hypothetical protein
MNALAYVGLGLNPPTIQLMQNPNNNKLSSGRKTKTSEPSNATKLSFAQAVHRWAKGSACAQTLSF